MPLNDFKKGQIVAYKDNGKGVREISDSLYASFNTVFNFIRKPDINGKRRKTDSSKKVNALRWKKIYWRA